MNDDQKPDQLDAALANEFARQFRTRAENQIGVPDYVTIASDAYEAHWLVIERRGVASMPSWSAISPDLRLAWVAAVKKAVESFSELVFADVGCFARAYAKGEPTFTLRAQDQTAAELVLKWIALNPKAPMHKLEEAFAIARRMQSWPDQKRAD